MPRKTLDVQFPTAGVVRRGGLRAATRGQGPFPAPWGTNVRLEGGITDRLRGGSFTAIAAGTRPTEILYRDRVLTFDSNAILATRMGDHTDTSLSADVTDAMRPTLFQLSEAGEVGDDVVALIPHKDSFLLGFTAGEAWVQQGDPLTGQRRNVSREVGIIGADAWCMNHDTVYFLSSHGLYSVGADGSVLTPISENTIPEDLTGVDDSSCTLTYNHADRGVYVHKTGVDWFYDTARKGFWPFDTDSTDSHILLGPFRTGQADTYGRLLRIHGRMAEGSDDVTWRTVLGETAEEAAANGKAAIIASLASESYSTYVQSSGTWVAGVNHTSYPRDRSQWIVLWLASAGDWAYEGVAMTALVSGRWR